MVKKHQFRYNIRFLLYHIIPCSPISQGKTRPFRPCAYVCVSGQCKEQCRCGPRATTDDYDNNIFNKILNCHKIYINFIQDSRKIEKLFTKTLSSNAS